MNKSHNNGKITVQVKQASPSSMEPIKIKDNNQYLQQSGANPKQKQIQLTVKEPIAQSQIQDSFQDVLPKHKTQEYSLRDNRTSQRVSVKNKMSDIQSQKKRIMNSLKEVDHQISSINCKERTNSQLHKRLAISNDLQAHKNALQLVKYYKQQKRQLQQKKQAHTCKIMINLKHQTAQNQQKHQEQEQSRREEKRKAISQRMDESRMHRQNNKLISRQTNQFISKLLKQEKQLQKNMIDLLKQQSERRMHLACRSTKPDLQKSSHLDKSGISNKYQPTPKKQRSATIDHPIKTYKKTKWSEILEQSDNRQKQQKLTKQITKKNNIKKRLKYGELVVSLFSQKRRARTLPNPQQQIHKVSVAEGSSQRQLTNAPFPRQQISQSKVIDNQTKSFNASPIRKRSIFKSQLIQKLSPEQLQLQNKKRKKEVQLRKQNKQRLKRITTTYQPEPHSKYQSNYQNYLGVFKAKRHSGPQNWNKLLNNQLIGKEQKYQKMIKEAESLQNRARLKQQIFRRSDESSDDLFMSSIHAKLMILQHI